MSWSKGKEGNTKAILQGCIKFWSHTLRENCLYSELFWFAFFRIQSEYGPEQFRIHTLRNDSFLKLSLSNLLLSKCNLLDKNLILQFFGQVLKKVFIKMSRWLNLILQCKSILHTECIFQYLFLWLNSDM